MIGDERTFEWLQHRAGIRKAPVHPMAYHTRALQLNQAGDQWLEAFGKREICGFAGFIDLVGFTSRVSNRRPHEISDYLSPFIVGVADAVFECKGLIDKTIGDEIMFILPDMEDDGGRPALLEIGFLFKRLYQLQNKLGPDYPFQIGLSYGIQFVAIMEGKTFREWTVIGASVNLAKKLQSRACDKSGHKFSGVFGVLTDECDEQRFETALEYVVGLDSPMHNERIVAPPNLIGTRKVHSALFFATCDTPNRNAADGQRS